MAIGYGGIFCVVQAWQTLVAGILALVGALLTIIVLNCQIRQEGKHEKRRQERAERAARAVLPLALISLSEYAEHCVQLLKPRASRKLCTPDTPEAAETVAVPAIPDGSIPVFRDCARDASDNVAQCIHEMLCFLQIQRSRLDKYLKGKSNTVADKIDASDAFGHLLEAIEMQLRCEQLFDYARNRSEEPAALVHKNIETKLFFFDIPIAGEFERQLETYRFWQP